MPSWSTTPRFQVAIALPSRRMIGIWRTSPRQASQCARVSSIFGKASHWARFQPAIAQISTVSVSSCTGGLVQAVSP